MPDIKKYIERRDNNPFNCAAHTSTELNFKRFFSNLALYRDKFQNVPMNKQVSATMLNEMTPRFQRENTKWNRDMQISFIENVLSGYRPEILLYFVSDQDAGFCNILDGLQRLTSIHGFLNDDFPVYGEFYYSDISKSAGTALAEVSIKVYRFRDHVTACRHYISRNKNITHSPEDLKVAYDFLKSPNQDGH